LKRMWCPPPGIAGAVLDACGMPDGWHVGLAIDSVDLSPRDVLVWQTFSAVRCEDGKLDVFHVSHS
jgi:hypothetical protein